MKLFIISILFGILLIAGCNQQQSGTGTSTITNTPRSDSSPSSNPQSSPNVKEFKMLVQHTGYSPSTITVNKGDKVRLLVTTASGQEYHKHGITIDEYNLNVPVQTTDVNNPVKIEFTADKTGTFKIYCKTCNDPDGWKGKTGTTHPDIQATLEVK